MSDVQVLEILFQALSLIAKLAGPLLAAALLIGIVVSIIQTVTQVQEMTLTFVPKLAATGGILVLAGNWMIRELVGFITTLWQGIATM